MMPFGPAPLPTEVSNLSVLLCDNAGAVDNIKLRILADGDFCALIKGRLCHTKKMLFEQFAAVLQFPSYFGHNWDAFEECIGDLSWLRGASVRVMIDDVLQVLRTDSDAQKTFWEIIASSLKSEISDFDSIERNRVLNVIVVEATAAKPKVETLVKSIAQLGSGSP